MPAINRRDVLRSATTAAAASALSTAVPTGFAAESAEPNPMRLWYPRPAGEWLEALPVGNGRMGAMVFGGITTETLQLNEDSVWAGGPHDYAPDDAAEVLSEIRRLITERQWLRAQQLADRRFMGRPTEQAPYQPVGGIQLSFPELTGRTEEYRRALDLPSGIASTTFRHNGIVHTREVFISHPDQIMVVRLAASEPGALSFEATFASPQRTTTSRYDDSTLLLDGVSGATQAVPGQVRFAAALRARPEGGTVTVDNAGLVVRGADAVTLLISIATSHRGYQDVRGDYIRQTRTVLDAATGLSYATLRRTHVEDFHRMFSRVDLDLGTSPAIERPTNERIAGFADGGDPQLAALYFQYGRYLLISSSRSPGQPANLQGLWNNQMNPAWESKYTLNINCQMNYWPAGPTNLAECWEPLFAMLAELAESGARTAKKMWDARGWVAHHNTDLWRGTAPVDHAFYGIWPLGGAWLSLLLWEHYEYTGELDTLRRYFPVLRGAVEFFLDTLVTDPATGYLVTNPSHSPEVEHHQIAGEDVSICAGPTIDMQILRDLFTAFDSAARTLGSDLDLARQAVAARRRLPPNQIGHLGQIQEWLVDWKETARTQNRHVSHMWGVFPSDQITPLRTPDLANATLRSLELRGDKVSTGWSLAWKMNLRARLLQPHNAYTHLTELLSPARTAPNMFDLHPPFQIDGNFGGTSALTEMLLQGHSGEVWLLPCLPTQWPNGQLRGLRTRGGFEVAMRWQRGALTDAELRSLRGSDAVVRTNQPVDVFRNGTPVPVKRPESGVATFATTTDATYLIRPRHTK